MKEKEVNNRRKFAILGLFLLCLVSCDFRSSDYYFSKAEQLQAEDKYAEAIILLDKVIAKNPQNIYALLNRGANKSMLNDYRGAIDDYSKVIEIDSMNTLAFFNRGLVKQRKEDYHSAIEDFYRAIKTKGSENFWMDWPANYFSKLGFGHTHFTLNRRQTTE